MNIFFDTTVLVAASAKSHPHHGQAWPALKRVATGRDKSFMSVHSIAEVYASLTRLPIQPRIHPLEAARIVTDNILPRFETVPIRREDYLEVLAVVASAGWSGAKIYDALLLRCAARCGAERIYTFNVVDFRQLALAGQQKQVCTPPI